MWVSEFSLWLSLNLPLLFVRLCWSSVRLSKALVPPGSSPSLPGPLLPWLSQREKEGPPAALGRSLCTVSTRHVVSAWYTRGRCLQEHLYEWLGDILTTVASSRLFSCVWHWKGILHTLVLRGSYSGSLEDFSLICGELRCPCRLKESCWRSCPKQTPSKASSVACILSSPGADLVQRKARPLGVLGVARKLRLVACKFSSNGISHHLLPCWFLINENEIASPPQRLHVCLLLPAVSVPVK